MSGINPVKKDDQTGQLANLTQIAKSVYDMKNGGAMQRRLDAQGEQPAPPPTQPDLSSNQATGASVKP